MPRVEFRSRMRTAILLSHTILLQLVVYVLRITTVYRALELGFAPLLVAFAAASFALLPIVFAVPVGRWADRRGERPAFVVGACIVLIACTGMLFRGYTELELVLFSALLGLGHLVSMVAQQSLVAATAGVERRERAFGRYTMTVSLGQVMAPLLIIMFGTSGAIPDTGAIIATCTGLAVLYLVNSLLLDGRPRTVPHETEGPRQIRRLLALPGLLAAVVAGLCVLTANDLMMIYLPVLGTERGIAVEVIGIMLTARAIAALASRFLYAWLMAKVGRASVLLLSSVAAATGIGLLAVPMPEAGMLAAVLLAGFGLGVSQPLTMSWVSAIAPPGMLSTALSLRLTGNRLGQFVIPTAAGLLAGTAGAAGVFVVTAVALYGVTFMALRRVLVP